MPAPALIDKRHPQLLTVLFWIGVAIAPVAALILLVADGNGPLRFAAVLAIMAVVLIGLSIALRGDSGGQPHGVDVLDELEQLRRELRSEIVAAAQRGNQALDQAQRVENQVNALRRRLDAAAAGIVAAVGLTGVEEPAGTGRARVPAPEPQDDPQGGRRRAVEEPATWNGAAADRDDEPAGSRYGVVGGGPVSGQAGGYGHDRPAAAASAGVYGAARPAPEPQGRPVLRHTETVRVTTRHTVVDGADPGVAGGYGGYAGRWSSGAEEPSWNAPEPEGSRAGQRDDPGWSAPRDERPWAAGRSDERPWVGGQPEDRPWVGGQPDERPWTAGTPEERPWDGRAEARTDQPWAGGTYPAEQQNWSGAQVGDRWAEVRDDGHAREVRVGERRAETYPDGAGFRVQDRWAAVRQDEPHQPAGQWGGGWAEPADRPALPQGGTPLPQEWNTAGPQPAEGQWGQQSVGQWRVPAPREPVDAWRAPEPESRHPQWSGEGQYGYPQQDGPRAGSRWG
ncbi:hypothetical protein [Micromonospora sp. KC723]|uniref:hypothetical protein n=1 Tax=Micromonospora sp. KC723 TaxID=2530381 RepID=UPI001A9F50CA|nr:hypothetical protein [Micromonospora sp. KC723]